MKAKNNFSFCNIFFNFLETEINISFFLFINNLFIEKYMKKIFFNSYIKYIKEKYFHPNLVQGLLASRWALGEYVLATRALRLRS